MSEFSELIKTIRGERTQRDFAALCSLSLRTINAIESQGESVQLSTLRQIKDACHLSGGMWLDLLIAWLKLELEGDFRRLNIAKARVPKLEQAEDQDVLHLFRLLGEPERKQILLTMQRDDVLRCLFPINAVWDSAKEGSSGAFDQELKRQAHDGMRPQNLSDHAEQLAEMKRVLAKSKTKS